MDRDRNLPWEKRWKRFRAFIKDNKEDLKVILKGDYEGIDVGGCEEMVQRSKRKIEELRREEKKEKKLEKEKGTEIFPQTRETLFDEVIREESKKIGQREKFRKPPTPKQLLPPFNK